MPLLSSRERKLRTLFNRLDEEGFYAIPGSTKQLAWKQLVRHGDLYSDETGRAFLVDAETVFESGIASSAAEASPIFERLGLPSLTVHEGRDASGSYVASVNQHSALLYPDTTESDQLWVPPTLRLLSLLEKVLIGAGAAERIYHDIVGNDTVVVVMSDKMERIIEESDAASAGLIRILKRPRLQDIEILCVNEEEIRS